MDTQLNEQACNLNSPLCARASEWMNGSSRWMNEWLQPNWITYLLRSAGAANNSIHVKTTIFNLLTVWVAFYACPHKQPYKQASNLRLICEWIKTNKIHQDSKIHHRVTNKANNATKRRRSRPFSKVPNPHPSIPGGEAGEWGPSLLAHPRKTPKGQCQCPASERVINTKLNSCIHLPNRMFFFCLFLGGCWSRFYFN